MNEPMAHFVMGRAHILDGEVEMGIGEKETAIALNPNFARGHFGLGWAHYYGAGQPAQALPHFDTALRLSPRDPTRWATLINRGSVLRDLGRYEEAVAQCRQACQFPDAPFGPYLFLASALAAAGKIGEVQAAVEKAVQLEPALSIEFVRSINPGAHENYVESLVDSLRKAGVPE
jgi:adenylate cyclase